jgi:hypothetical protein
MLFDLLYPLREHFFAFNVFRYITFRAAYATLTAFLLAFLLGPWVIAKLRQKGVVKFVRAETPSAHQAKTGTPTMGGLLILAAVIIPTLLWADLSSSHVRLALLVTLWLGAIGFLDDYLQVVRKQPRASWAAPSSRGRSRSASWWACCCSWRRTVPRSPRRRRSRSSRTASSTSAGSTSRSSCSW